MHVLITGGAGFIGSHLAELLLKRNYRVTIIDDLSTGSLYNIQHLMGNPDFRYAIDTITNEVVMDRLVSECDVVFHLAAAVGVDLIMKDPVRVIETNIHGADAVLRVANRYRRKVLIASTSEVYGKNERVPFNEEHDSLFGPTTKSRWSYAMSKAIDEFLGLAYYKKHDLPVVIFRLFNTVGPRQTGQYGMVVPRFVQQAMRGEPLTIYGDGSQSRCFCDVSDVVQAIAGLAEAPEAVGQVFNIGSDREITILQLAQRVIELVGQGPRRNGGSEQDGQVRFIPYEEAYEVGFEDMHRRVPDVRKINTLLGWESRIGIDDTIRRVIAHFQTRPDAPRHAPAIHLAPAFGVRVAS